MIYIYINQLIYIMNNLTHEFNNILFKVYDNFYEMNYKIYNLDINEIYKNNIILYLVIFLNITIIYSTNIYCCFKNAERKNINNNQLIERIIKIEKDVQTTLKILRQIKNLECL